MSETISTQRISANVPPFLVEQIDEKAKEMEISSRSELLRVAAETFLENADSHEKVRALRKDNASLRKDNATLQRNLSQVRKNLDNARSEKADVKSELAKANMNLTAQQADLEETQANLESVKTESSKQLKEIAVKLGVPDTVAHIQQRIAELNDNYDLVTSENSNLETKITEVEAENIALKKRGLFSRLFNRIPKQPKSVAAKA